MTSDINRGTSGKVVPGLRRGRLVVREKHDNIRSGEARWLCDCDCGRTAIVRRNQLNLGRTQSCGCLRTEALRARHTTHGGSRTFRYLLLYRARQHAKAKGHPIEITIDDIVIPEICPALGILLDENAPPRAPNKPSIDRIDNSKGYVPGNVAVISWRANQLKRDATVLEIEGIAAYVRAGGAKAI